MPLNRELPPLQEKRKDLGGAHEKSDRPSSKDLVQGEWPPGVGVYYGVPKDASPFIQTRLPQGYKFEKRQSKAVSFFGDNLLARGTLKTKPQAEQACMAWTWAWWNALSAEQQSAIQTSEPSKRRRLA